LEAPPTGPARARWKSSGRLREGEELSLLESGRILRVVASGKAPLLEPAGGSTWQTILEGDGKPPLPPYIKRPFAHDPRLAQDRERYQAVYARTPGSIAAPTAGLHLTDELLEKIEARGVTVTRITLHVGPGTFLPVASETLEAHRMHPEGATLTEEVARDVRDTRLRGKRVVAVGTTVVRTLEAASESGEIRPFDGETSLFIRPPFTFHSTDALLTNFHLPRSTLIALVGAFAGLERVLELYREAVRLGYRFYSYGDACFFH
ncbi:MAG: S-adenosylmethionine:tRNA ribosyltransferase-isomerase, partial [Planctomycetota bacterium]